MESIQINYFAITVNVFQKKNFINVKLLRRDFIGSKININIIIII